MRVTTASRKPAGSNASLGLWLALRHEESPPDLAEFRPHRKPAPSRGACNCGIVSEFPAGENKFKEFFAVTPHTRNDGTGKVHVNFQIEAKKQLPFMKRDSTFFNYLRKNKIWLTEHKYETHALRSIGWIAMKSPELTNKPMLESDIVRII